MRPASCEDDLVDLCGRLVLSHAIDPEFAARVLGIEREEAEAMVVGACAVRPLSVGQQERLSLFVNILIRIEWRCQHDSRAIRQALVTPLDGLGGVAPADRLDGDLDALRLIRHMVDQIEVPRIRWWRVGH
jgi:hypothetical protein